jgi:hypothetical protein
MKNLADFLD